MAVWKFACKTMQGMNLDLKLVSRGNLPLKLTKSMSGAGRTSPTQLMTLSDLIDPVQELQIQDAVERLESGVVKIPVLLKNNSVTKKYDMHQLGIYAEDPDLGEILYMVLQSDSAEEIPTSTEIKDFTLEWYLNLSVGNTQDVEVVIDETCVLTTEQADARYVSQTGDTSNTTTKFVQASTRENIISGEKLSVIFGKLMKWFVDLKTVAFSGKYTDLIDKPTIPAAVRVKGNAESAYRTGDVNLTAENIGAVNKSGDTIPGRLKFINSGDIRFITPDVTTGDHARGMAFMDKSGTDIWGGIGVFGRAGEPQHIYIGAGTASPWSSSEGLYITNTNILWKNSKLVTENSGIAKEATRLSDSVFNTGKLIHPTTDGAWRRLGHLEKSSQIYAEFIVTHTWNYHVPEVSKFIVAGGCLGTSSFNIKEIFASWHNNPNVQCKFIRKARVVYYPIGSSGYNIYVDIFLQDLFSTIKSPDLWYYRLNQNGVFRGSTWTDDNFGTAEIPSGYKAKEVSFV